MDIKTMYWRNQTIRAMLGEIKLENMSALMFRVALLSADDVIEESQRLYEELKKKGIIYEK